MNDIDNLPALNFPRYPFRFKLVDTDLFIFDEIRGKHIKNTPEEWVRQHIVHLLMADKGYPKGLISVEKGIQVNQQDRRYDVLVYNRQGQPLILIECKAPKIKISQDTCDQAVIYNQKIGSKYIVLTNGMQTFCLEYTNNQYHFIKSIPNSSMVF